jgi:NAD(P)-dependent dehydrogenase (short-subunit alcohol dehydrogenase family)
MRDLEGKTAFITGGASGIGLGMARAFLGAGMNVIVADLRVDHIAQAAEALRAELAPEGIGVSAFCPGGVRSNIREYEKTRPERFTEAEAEAPTGPPPSFASRFTPEQLEKLGSLTHSAEEAGEIVLRGVRDNALYIFTAPEFRPGIEERFDAILRATGEDKAREETALALIPGLIGSPIYRES